MAQRKCPNCSHWNIGKDYCEKCEAALSADAISKEREARLIQEEENKPKDKTDIWIEKIKNHKYLFVRISFQILYSIWAIFMAFVGFFVWLTIGSNG